MSDRFTARRAAAALALRWHAGTGTLVALTAALTTAGSLPAVALLGHPNSAPALTLALGDTAAILADWNGRGIVWPQLQQLALQQLTHILGGAVLMTLMVGAATLLALHLARTAARSGEIVVARSVGASKRDVFTALLLEAAALAGVALCVGTVIALGAASAMRATWPGATAPASLALTIATALGIAALVLIAPLLMARALSTTRLVDDDRRPLTLIIPTLQLGAALVVLAGGAQLRDVTTRAKAQLADPSLRTTLVQNLHADETDRLARAQHFAAFLDAQHTAHPGQLISLGSSGVHRGLGTTATVTADCGRMCTNGVAVRGHAESITHHVVSGDTFALGGIRVLRGRALDNRDRWDAPLVAVVNESVARTLFNGANPVGQRLQLSMLGNRWFEIVGVVSDAQPKGLGSAVQLPLAVYVSVLQHPVAMVEVGTTQTSIATDALRTIGTPSGAPRSIRDHVDTEITALQWFARVLFALGLITAIIAVGGLIAMLHLWLESQARELGIRRAVGASRAAIHRLVLGKASIVAICGSLFGAWLGQIAWDVLPRIVPGASPFDRTTVAITAAALSTLTLIVAYATAHRFTRTPVSTLLIEIG